MTRMLKNLRDKEDWSRKCSVYQREENERAEMIKDKIRHAELNKDMIITLNTSTNVAKH